MRINRRNNYPEGSPLSLVWAKKNRWLLQFQNKKTHHIIDLNHLQNENLPGSFIFWLVQNIFGVLRADWFSICYRYYHIYIVISASSRRKVSFKLNEFKKLMEAIHFIQPYKRITKHPLIPTARMQPNMDTKPN